MNQRNTDIRSTIVQLDRKLAALEVMTGAETMKAEKEHAAVFSRWLRAPEDHAIKAALRTVEDDLAGRQLVQAEDALTFATREKERAEQAAEADFADRAKRKAARIADLEYQKKRVAFLDAKDRFEIKDATIDDGPSGGYAVPSLISAEIARQAVLFNPFRRLVRQTPVSSSDFAFLLEGADADSGWVGETDNRSATDTPTLGQRTPSFGEVYARPRCSEWALDDFAFDIGQWLARSCAAQFARREAIAVVNGTGTKQLSGFLKTAPSTTADDASPARAATSLQYFNLSSSPAALSLDDLIDLSNSVADEYLEEVDAVAWVMRRSTLSSIRKLKTTTGAPIVIDGAGPRPLLLGWPVECTAAMDVPGSDGFPIAFGNWARGYGLADRGALKIDAKMVTPGFVDFYVRRRVGGTVIDNQAVKLLKF